jgi:hypothetical protein
MTGNNEDLQIEWMIACLSPGDIAPHPNFRADIAHGAELLALVVKFQWGEYDTYRELAEDEAAGSATGSGNDVVPKAARQALYYETVHEGLRCLIDAAQNANLSMGQRAAAALLASVTDSDLDRPEAHIGLLRDLAYSIENRKFGASGSRSLAVGVLLQQCALRTLEAGLITESRHYAQQVIAALTTIEQNWDEFPVSRGISWSAFESQRRLVDLISINARSLLASTAGPGDKSWIEIVRAPFPTAATRPLRDTLSALTTVVDETFARTYASAKQTITLGRGDRVLRLLYSSLLNAELTGDLGDVASTRQLTGNVLAVRMSNESTDPTDYKEAIRLLRQADSKDHLRRVLQRIRMQGPLETLQVAAESVIDTRAAQSFITSSDLTLLERSADIISPSRTIPAVELAIRYTSQSRDGRVKGSIVAHWKRIETTLKTVSTLLTGNPDVDMPRVARMTLNIPRLRDSVDQQFVVAAFAELTSHIDWDSVPLSIRSDWLSVLSTAASSCETLAIDLLRAYATLKEVVPKEIEQRVDGHEFVAALINRLLGDPPEDEVLDRAAMILTNAMETIREDAIAGKFVGYAWSPFAMAAALIVDFGRADLWPALVGALTDPKVSNLGKIDALRTLTTGAPRVRLPNALKVHLSSKLIRLAENSQDRFFSVSANEFDIVRRNFFLSFDLTLPEKIQDVILRDVGSREARTRSETARSCLLMATKQSILEWPRVLLLQLSHDRDPLVRNSASRAIAQLSVSPDGALRDALTERVTSLLSEPGIAMPMGALEGLDIAASNGANAGAALWCRDSLHHLMNTHVSRNIRRTARLVLARYGESH